MDIKTESLIYIRDRYFEEQSRFKHIEDKCGKLITLLTILIAVLGAFANLNINNLFNPCTWIEWAILVIVLLVFFVLSCSWGHSLLALKVGNSPVATKTRENADYIISANEEDALKQIVNCYISTIEELTPIIDEKAINIKHAYDELVISAWLIGSFSILFIIKEILL